MRKKSQSPRKGRTISIGNKGREEHLELPQLSSFPDGNKTYFIGGWSAFTDFSSSVSTVANQVKPANQAEEEPFLSHFKKISALNMNAEEENERGESLSPPEHKIIVLPGVVNGAGDEESHQSCVAQLTHGVTIMGFRPSEEVKKQEEFDRRIKNRNAEDVGNAVEEQEPNVDHKEKKRYEVYYDNDEESQAYDEDGNPVTEKPAHFRKAVPIDPDDLVIIRGNIILEGIKPIVSVPPPSKKEMQQRITAAAKAAGVTLGGVTAAGKTKRRTDEDKQREAEIVSRVEAESLASMSLEVERLSAFADPDRWPTVIISNLAFSGPIIVKRTHIQFSNCHFGSLYDKASFTKSMVSVTQYCRVSFSECTFIEPVTTALYLFPAAECVVHQCIFSGLPQPKTNEEVEDFIKKPLCSFKESDLAIIKRQRYDSVGIHCDSAKITVRDCHFEALGTGVICRGEYSVSVPTINGEGGQENEGTEEGTNSDSRYGTSSEVNEEGHRVIRVRRPVSVLTGNVFQHIFKTSLIFVSAQRTLSKDNSFYECGYYAIQCFGPKCTPQIIKSNVHGKIFIGEEAHPFLHGNIVTDPIINKNDKEPVYLQTIY
eukprot:Tbor_TRINITY_DN3311_c0_g1::TRINITY_DN3311_c0_g1_i1::g.23499::m.23499